MKKVLALTGCMVLLMAGAYATPRHTPVKNAEPKEAKAMLEKQLSTYISCPEELQQTNRNGVVVIQFNVSDEGRISKLVVHSGNEAVNTNLIKQLTGRKVNLPDVDPEHTYTARLHFNVEK
ncbi:TonB C-terminal domain-containing protein [Arsenicibacter rosenii]|uniref:TonB C-terminal domain-containing protein n=1 Tax=Arsenicibacter rosenii TaxID=1750698 RepID=A0A1S2VJS4_9BACT|nr:TonB C-terminal domain-containing protein [Arsenicibacter rosenii]OIN58983.1 hypothetical protein BLX24_12255 [Arsenicibacter rosenii]